jgi:hypothetical protein
MALYSHSYTEVQKVNPSVRSLYPKWLCSKWLLHFCSLGARITRKSLASSYHSASRLKRRDKSKKSSTPILLPFEKAKESPKTKSPPILSGLLK